MTEYSRRSFLRLGGLAATTALAAGCTSSRSAGGGATRTPAAGALPAATTSSGLASSGPTSSGTTVAAEAAFPKDFWWGAATSAYQIEGGASADGKGPSVWDTFAHLSGKIADGSTGDVAADHYHRYADDIALMASMGLRSYRFSISWPRVLPTGAGAVNQRGLDFYKKLIDGLHERGIRPMPTLWHWDTPQSLQDAGGWENRDTAKHFADYAALLAKALGDRVPVWLTLNEPKTVVQVGYIYGAHAPGKRDPHAAYTAAHHLLLGHGLATQAVRAASSSAKVGIPLNVTPVYPDDASDAAAVAAAKARDGIENRLYLGPVLKGAYPDDVLQALASQDITLPVKDGDLKTIAAGVDVLGVNYYGPTIVGSAGEDVQKYPTSQATWEQIYPNGLRDMLGQVKQSYGDVTISITENGIPTTQDPGADGVVDDPDRVDYLRTHLLALRQAMSDGVRVEGYHLWSLMDNFEWAEGYTQRWGITRVDFDTLKRTPKRSAHWYSGVIAANRVTS
jgi:beta-glucosidase